MTDFDDNDPRKHATDEEFAAFPTQEGESERIPSEEDGDDEFIVESFWHRRSLSDPEAFTYFIDKYYERVHRFLLVMLRDRGEAEHVTQDTFLNAFEYRRRFVFRRQTIESWIFQIARRNGFKAGKKLSRHVRLQPEDLDEERLIEFRPDPERRLLGEEERRELLRALDELDPDCKSWLALHYVVGLPTPRVAAIAGVTTGTMKSRLSRCRAKLKERLEREG